MAHKKTKAKKDKPSKPVKDAGRKLPEGISENSSSKKTNSLVPEAEALPGLRRRKQKGRAWFSQTPYDLGCFSVKDMLTNKLSLASNVFAIFLGTVLTALLLSLLAGTEAYIEWTTGRIAGLRSVSVWIDYSNSTGGEPFSDQEIKDFEQWEEVEILVPIVNQFVPLFEKEARETIVSMFSTSPGDPELKECKVVAGSLDVDPDGWDIVIPMSVAEELNNFYPEGLAGKKITMQLKRYGSIQDMEKGKASKVYGYPVRVVGVIDRAPDERVYGSLNMVRFIRDFATARSKYLPQSEGKIEISQISARTMNETLKLHFLNARAAENAFYKIRRNERFQAAWPGQQMLWLRDVQLVSSAVLVMIGILALVAGAVSIFNSQLAAVARKTREIGILRALGFTRLDVFFIFLGQAVLVGLLACCGGLLVSMIAVQTLNDAIPKHWEILSEANEAIGGIFQFEVTTGGILVCAVLLICVLASLLPSLRASGMTPMDALREE